MKVSFVDKGRYEMLEFVEKGINDLLAILDSPIVYPRDKTGQVQEHKLLAVVRSREQVYVSAMNLIDLISIGSPHFMEKIISGLKTTWRELTIITTRNIGDLTEEEKEQSEGFGFVEDNYLASIAQAKELSAKVAFSILDRIEKLEMTEEEKTEMMQQKVIANTAERYAKKYAK